ncbi:MAG TPA: hypothetical protein VKU36_03595 [Candidatus Babeliales bacterium]|nr:hypothetical protein [Candidatus Babeliales bacterium]
MSKKYILYTMMLLSMHCGIIVSMHHMKLCKIILKPQQFCTTPKVDHMDTFEFLLKNPESVCHKVLKAHIELRKIEIECQIRTSNGYNHLGRVAGIWQDDQLLDKLNKIDTTKILS